MNLTFVDPLLSTLAISAAFPGFYALATDNDEYLASRVFSFFLVSGVDGAGVRVRLDDRTIAAAWKNSSGHPSIAAGRLSNRDVIVGVYNPVTDCFSEYYADSMGRRNISAKISSSCGGEWATGLKKLANLSSTNLDFTTTKSAGAGAVFPINTNISVNPIVPVAFRTAVRGCSEGCSENLFKNNNANPLPSTDLQLDVWGRDGASPRAADSAY